MTGDEDDRSMDDEARAERRSQPRTAPASGEWESVVLRRVARRVESLNATPGPAGEPTAEDGFGWEAASLRNLGRHLKDHEES